jgi:hypothetical protein
MLTKNDQKLWKRKMSVTSSHYYAPSDWISHSHHMTAFKFCHSGILIFGDGENIFNASF